jgi:hypothetical protein
MTSKLAMSTLAMTQGTVIAVSVRASPAPLELCQPLLLTLSLVSYRHLFGSSSEIPAYATKIMPHPKPRKVEPIMITSTEVDLAAITFAYGQQEFSRWGSDTHGTSDTNELACHDRPSSAKYIAEVAG